MTTKTSVNDKERLSHNFVSAANLLKEVEKSYDKEKTPSNTNVGISNDKRVYSDSVISAYKIKDLIYSMQESYKIILCIENNLSFFCVSQKKDNAYIEREFMEELLSIVMRTKIKLIEDSFVTPYAGIYIALDCLSTLYLQ